MQTAARDRNRVWGAKVARTPVSERLFKGDAVEGSESLPPPFWGSLSRTERQPDWTVSVRRCTEGKA